MNINTNIVSSRGFDVEMQDFHAPNPVVIENKYKKIKKELGTIRSLSSLKNDAAKSLAGKATDLFIALNKQKEAEKYIMDGILLGEAAGGLTGITVEVSMLVAGVKSAGLVLGCTFATFGAVWLIGIIAAVYLYNKKMKGCRRNIEQLKSEIQDLIQKNKPEIMASLAKKIEESEKEKAELLQKLKTMKKIEKSIEEDTKTLKKLEAF